MLPPEQMTLIAGAILAFGLTVYWHVWNPSRIVARTGLADNDLPRHLLIAGIGGYLTWLAFAGIGMNFARMLPATQPAQGDRGGAIVVLAVVVAGASALVVLLTILRLQDRRMFAWLGASRRDLLPSVPISLGGILIFIPLTFATAWATDLVFHSIEPEGRRVHEFLQLAGERRSLVPVIIISAVVVAPLFEEFLFRGCLQTALVGLLTRAAYSPATARWLAIVIASLLFALNHGHLWMVPPLFVLSMCLGYAYERSGRLWAPILMHAMFNLISILNFVLSGLKA